MKWIREYFDNNSVCNSRWLGRMYCPHLIDRSDERYEEDDTERTDDGDYKGLETKAESASSVYSI